VNAPGDSRKIPVKFPQDHPFEMPEPEDAAPQPEETGEAEAAAVPGEHAGGDDALRQELARLKAERDDLQRTLVRLQADFENYRKRIQRERPADAERGATRVIEQLLPVLDAFDRALAAHQDPAWAEYRRGIELIQRQLLDALGRFGVERIEAAGRPFDPHVHQAVERVETAEHAEGTVMAELAAGYRIGERVLRPTMVRVAAAPAHADRSAGTEGQ
jgi:molecular chaperone GrpE